MTGVLTIALDYAGLAAASLWLVFRLLRLIALRENALPVAFSLVLITLVVWPGNPVFAGAVALLAPFGVLLPALALRSITRSLGVSITPFHWIELVVFVCLYVALLASAAGALPIDIYAFGYTPLGAIALALVFCVPGFIRNALFLPLVGLAATLLWAAGIGSANAFDNLSHLLLLPLAIFALPGAVLRRD